MIVQFSVGSFRFDRWSWRLLQKTFLLTDDCKCFDRKLYHQLMNVEYSIENFMIMELSIKNFVVNRYSCSFLQKTSSLFDDCRVYSVAKFLGRSMIEVKIPYLSILQSFSTEISFVDEKTIDDRGESYSSVNVGEVFCRNHLRYWDDLS